MKQRMITYALCFLAGLLLVSCKPKIDYQQVIEQPDGPLYRWDDLSLGVVCYGRNTNSNGVALSCVALKPH